MNYSRIFLSISLATVFVFLIYPVSADSGSQSVLYETSFASNPQWTTNNPSSDYWDPTENAYHFQIEPSTGNYAYSPDIDYQGGSFSLEYDVMLERVDDGATFRLGFSGTDVDFNKGPNVVTEFTNNKYGRIMILHIVTQSAKMEEVTSYTGSYGGPTVKFDLNTTYHVQVDYNQDTDVVTETVTNKATGSQVWSYYIGTRENLKNMKRIYIGSVGDYSTMNIFATGWIDNVRLTSTTTSAASASTPTTVPVSTQPTYSLHPTTKPTTYVPLTSIQTSSRKSPVSSATAVAALGIAGICTICFACRRRQEK